MKKLLNLRLNLDNVVNHSILLIVFGAAILTLVNTVSSSENPVFDTSQITHVSLTTGLFLMLVGLKMLVDRPVELYVAGILGGMVIVTAICTAFGLKLPWAEALFGEHVLEYDYPSFNTQLAFLCYSLAVLCHSKYLGMSVGLFGVLTLVGQVFDIPVLYGFYPKYGSGMSTFVAVLLILMTFRLMRNFFPGFDFHRFIPTFSKLLDMFIRHRQAHVEAQKAN